MNKARLRGMVDDLLKAMGGGVRKTEVYGGPERGWKMQCIYCGRRWYQSEKPWHRDDCPYQRAKEARDWEVSDG